MRQQNMICTYNESQIGSIVHIKVQTKKILTVCSKMDGAKVGKKKTKSTILKWLKTNKTTPGPRILRIHLSDIQLVRSLEKILKYSLSGKFS